jgi:hypothetical protein
MQRRTTGIVRLVPAADYTNYEGYGVTIAAGIATLNASTTVPNDGVIIEGGTVGQGVGVALLGNFEGGCDVKLSGAGPFAQGTKLVQAADGSFIIDPGTGTNRVNVGVLNEAGVAGDLREAFLRTPVYLT